MLKTILMTTIVLFSTTLVAEELPSSYVELLDEYKVFAKKIENCENYSGKIRNYVTGKYDIESIYKKEDGSCERITSYGHTPVKNICLYSLKDSKEVAKYLNEHIENIKNTGEIKFITTSVFKRLAEEGKCVSELIVN
jgi:hypothetical protein